MRRYHLELPPAPLHAETILGGNLCRVRIGPARRVTWRSWWALVVLALALALLVPDASPPTP